MSHISQHIHEAFPADGEVIARLKADDAHFQALAERFAAIDGEVAHSDDGSALAGEAETEDLKKRRLALLDEIAVVIDAARAA